MPELPEVETVRRGLASALELPGLAKAVPDILAGRRPGIDLSSLPRLQECHFQRSTLRYPLPIAGLQALRGSYLLAVERRSKYLWLYFSRDGRTCEADQASKDRPRSNSEAASEAANGARWAEEHKLYRLTIHLGMTGVLRVLPELPEPARHDHIWLRFALRTAKASAEHMGSRDAYLLYNDVRRFGFWELQDWQQLSEAADCSSASQLGLEPLPLTSYREQAALSLALLQGEHPAAVAGTDLAPMLYRSSRRLLRELKPWLLEGKAVCGLGNIYCSESLWHAALSPFRRTGSLSRARAERLAAAIQQTIAAAIEAGGTTLKDFRSAEGRPGYFRHELRVYGRAGAACRRPGCKGKIVKCTQGQRATYYCPECQN